MNLLELQGISFTYPDEEEPVFTGLSLEVPVGQSLILRGDNGSGKTTLFRILNGLSFPTAGKYIFQGTEITEKYLRDNGQAKKFHQRIGYLFQNPDIMLFNGKVYDEIAFGPRQMGLSEEEVAKRVEDCMELFHITHLADKAPYHLSGGQKKRVALASVIALNPQLLILDEPFAGLDGKSKEDLMAFLQQWKAAGKTQIIATHDEELTKRLGDAVYTM
ncbi:MAG: ABC transporter ATP-binding protein [Lachnospiraceae bacterium]|jgi:cobalt/nickel transport system ATP-binding protein|nr:ABC transporter ATP-binding protein [Lachnospiraceae bacterium]MBQ2466881.1 ABC transporter ATP-binding protein [Lachnospiraceae bacterium]